MRAVWVPLGEHAHLPKPLILAACVGIRATLPAKPLILACGSLYYTLHTSGLGTAIPSLISDATVRFGGSGEVLLLLSSPAVLSTNSKWPPAKERARVSRHGTCDAA